MARPAQAGAELTAADLSETLAGLIAERRRTLDRPILVGLAGPQGSGKSTLAHRLSDRLRLAILSLDDFYLTRLERLDLAARVHPLLVTRGPPGTHDLALLEAAVDGLLAGNSATVPRFDKAADDRALESLEISAPIDVILLEGWCVGVEPQTEEALDEPVNDLEREADPAGVWRRFVNDALVAYQPLFDRLDLMIQLQAPSFDVVADWRWEQEAKLQADRGGDSALKIMSKAQVGRFIQHYERITRHMQASTRAAVVVNLARDRSVVGLETS